MFFEISTVTLFIVLCVIIGGAAALGIVIGRRLRNRPEPNHQPVGVVQGTLLGLVGLLLAFGLTMSVGRYESRRAVVLEEANDIGTTYLRAQLLAEPERSKSLQLMRDYTDVAIDLASQVPDSARFDADAAQMERMQQDLWAAAGRAVAADPTGSAPRLYIETLNDTIDAHTARVASLNNRVPTTVIFLQIIGSAIAIGVLALYLALLGRGMTTSLVAAGLVIVILFVSFDLDRPERGFITVPHTTLVDARASMDLPPAADGP